MPKSSSFSVAVGGDQDVRGLEVAVDDEVLVRVLHRLADLAEQRQPRVDVEAAARRNTGDRLPFDVLHDEVRAAVRR